MSDTAADAAESRAEPEMNRPIFWGGLVIGGAAMAFGIRGLIDERAAASPLAVGRLLVGSALFHDALLAPAVFLLGWAIARYVPGWARAAVQAGLFASAVIALYAWPFVRGYGRADTNPSALPVNYGRGLTILVALIWLAVAVGLQVRRPRTRLSTESSKPLS